MPAPNMPTIIGSTTVSANAVATAASTALPPIASISAPAADAMGWLEATMPREPAADFLNGIKGLPARSRQPLFTSTPRMRNGAGAIVPYGLLSTFHLDTTLALIYSNLRLT